MVMTAAPIMTAKRIFDEADCPAAGDESCLIKTFTSRVAVPFEETCGVPGILRELARVFRRAPRRLQGKTSINQGAQVRGARYWRDDSIKKRLRDRRAS